MSVRYTATWYDVTQAWQQDTLHTHRHVPARPAGLQLSVLSHTLSSIAETGSWDSVCWCDRVKMVQQCVVICS